MISCGQISKSFICSFQHKGAQKEVLVDLVIQNDKEIPPAGYRLIDKTLDTCELPFIV